MINLIKGDCLEVMKGIKSGSVDAIITDPPYGTTQCKWDSVIDFELMWLELNRIIKPNGAIVLFGSEPFSSALRMSNIKNYKYDWVWDKVVSGSMLNCKKQPMRIVENIIVFNSKIYFPIMNDDGLEKAKERLSKKPKKQFKKTTLTGNYNQKTRSDYTLESQRYSYPKNILKYNKVKNECNSRKRLHPTQKPIELMEYLIKTYTNENETVLDFTMGSGSTGVACVNTNRNFVGIELDDEYFKIATDRINKEQPQKNYFEVRDKVCDKDKQTLINYLKELGNDYLVDVKKQRNTRSNMQNNYYWSCIVQVLSNELGYFPDEIHDLLKVKFSSEWNSIEINDRSVGIQVVKSTARMDSKAFEIYADQIRMWAITELGIRLMLPNEYE